MYTDLKGEVTDGNRSLPTVEKKQPKLRWYQWRLRSLFLLTLLVAVGMSCFVTIRNLLQRQYVAAVAIMTAGGSVESEQTWLGELLGTRSLVTVSFAKFPDRSVGNVDFAYLQVLTQLEGLRLRQHERDRCGLGVP